MVLMVGLVLVVTLAGCVSNDSPGATEAPAATVDAIDLDGFPVDLNHDHAVADLHHVQSGLEPVAFLRTTDGLGPRAQVYNLDRAGDLLVASLASLATGSALAPPMALLVADVEDPTDPSVLSVTRLPGGGVESVAVSPDGRFAFLGTEFSGAVGVWTIDLANPASPEILTWTPIATEGPHNIRYGVVGDRPFLFASIAHVATAASVAGAGQDPIPVYDLRVDLYEFDPDAPEMPLTFVSSYAADDQEGIQDGEPIVHDAIYQEHPVTEQPLLYVAHWDRGVRIVDLTDPDDPIEIGRYTDPAPTDFLTIHTVKPHPTLIDGRHVTVATAQCAYTPDSPCYVRILDTTDPSNAEQVGVWTLPDQVHGSIYTTEIFDLADGVLVMPWLHAGTWSLDIGNATRLADPVATGYYFGSADAPAPLEGARTPNANAVVVKGDYAFVADVGTGIHVLRLA